MIAIIMKIWEKIAGSLRKIVTSFEAITLKSGEVYLKNPTKVKLLK